MVQTPLPGEQSALMGYRWQYDHIARLVYDGIVESTFESVKLASTDAGQIDDLLINYHDRRAAFQYKAGVSKATVTFAELVRPGRTPSGAPTDSLWKALARGWTALKTADDRPLSVHLATVATASTSDHLVDRKSRSTIDHFRAFLSQVLEPLRDPHLARGKFSEWADALEKLQTESGLSQADFRKFLGDVRLDFGQGDALENASGSRLDDIEDLSNVLFRRVSRSSGAVELDRDQVLSAMKWHDRKSFRSVHEFPVDRSRYSPLAGAIAALQKNLGALDSGYIAVTGPPGAGKSTLLTQTLSGLSDRVVRYYAFVPGGGGGSRNRLSAEWFLHDLSTMLRNAGVQSRQKQLTPQTVNELRQLLNEQLDAASDEFRASGRKTILVVDGLDHVQRDYAGNDALTGELPRPSDLPIGVVLLVGTRDLSPLSSEAKQFIESIGSEINLEHHRLARSAVLEICKSDTTVGQMPDQVHDLVADRSAGHPLALAYLLNQLEAIIGQDPVDFLRAVPAYDGDIAGQYRAVWDQLTRDPEIIRLLRICSRLRIGFELEWVRTWASEAAVFELLTTLRYLFRVERRRWRFFHDSFRQFTRERTSIGEHRVPDEHVDALAHAETAELCERSTTDSVGWQALYHRFEAGQFDHVLRVGTQESFRRQFEGLRSASDIKDDARLVLTAAARDNDFPGLLRGLLILSEIEDKADELEEIDVSHILLAIGRVDDAIDFVGDEQSLNVRLARAYELAAELARQSNAAGYRIFESVHHFGLAQPGLQHGINTDAEVATAWGRCAAHFLPVDIALARARDLIPAAVGEREWDFDTSYNLFAKLMRSYATELAKVAPSEVPALDKVVAEEIQLLQKKGLAPERLERLGASLGNLRYRIRAAQVEAHTDHSIRAGLYAELHVALLGTPIYHSTLLDMAEQEAEYMSSQKALTTLLRTNYDASLALEDLSATGDDQAIQGRLRYWTLRHELEIGLGTFSAGTPLKPMESAKPNPATPAGDSTDPSAPVHGYSDAIRVANQIDRLVRTLGLVRALVDTGAEIDEEAVWAVLGSSINIFPPFEPHADGWSSMHGLRSKREELYALTIHTLGLISPTLLSRFHDAFEARFRNQAKEWPTALQLEIGMAFRAEGLSPAWLTTTLKQFETEVSAQGVNGALTDLQRLVLTFAEMGENAEASRIADELAGRAFGLGSRNDHQLAYWIEWFGRAASGLDEGDRRKTAFWLAQVSTAAEPLTDDRIGADALPAAIVPASPALALEIFEYMVGNGAISHTDGMSKLLTALLTTGTLGTESVQLVADLVGEIVVAAANRADTDLGHALKQVAPAHVLEALAVGVSTNALPTTRSTWAGALFGETAFEPADDAGDDESYNSLELSDGSKLTRREVIALSIDLPTLAALVSDEAIDSTFTWVKVLQKNFIDGPMDPIIAMFENTPHIGAVLLWFAESAIAAGDQALANSLAQRALAHLPLDSWTSNRKGGRRRAIGILTSTGALSARDAAVDFAAFVAEERWYSHMLHAELDEILGAIGHDIPAAEFWPDIQEYLVGYTDGLELPTLRPSPTIKWWARDNDLPTRMPAALTAEDVVAELAAIHLTHPAWSVREGVARVVVASLNRGAPDMSRALDRLVESEPTDDVLESIVSCIAASTTQTNSEFLRSHPNVFVRRLANGGTDLSEVRLHRPLPGSYALLLPDQGFFDQDELFGDGVSFLFPFAETYEAVSAVAGLELDAVLAVAGRYASEALALLPEQELVMDSLSASSMRLANPSNLVLASRSACGRVLGDLLDAGRLEDLSPDDAPLCRSADIGLVGARRSPKPSAVPSPPSAGHDQTTERWLSETESRMDEFVSAARAGSSQLIAGKSSLTVLNWPHLEEEFRCFVTRRSRFAMPERMFNAIRADLEWDGVSGNMNDLESIVLENEAMAFMERRSDWTAFHPVLARSLGWVPDAKMLGGWLDGSSVAVYTVDWNDGTWGRSGPMFDDTTSEGFATIISVEALVKVQELVGPLDLVFHLKRYDQKKTQPAKITQRRVKL